MKPKLENKSWEQQEGNKNNNDNNKTEKKNPQRTKIRIIALTVRNYASQKRSDNFKVLSKNYQVRFLYSANTFQKWLQVKAVSKWET